jgi:hypothetical protein
MFLGKIEKDTFGFATFLLRLFKTGFDLSVSGYPKCILNVSYIGAPFVFSCLIYYIMKILVLIPFNR